MRHGCSPEPTLPRKVIIQRRGVRVPGTLSLLLKPELQKRIRKEHTNAARKYFQLLSIVQQTEKPLGEQGPLQVCQLPSSVPQVLSEPQDPAPALALETPPWARGRRWLPKDRAQSSSTAERGFSVAAQLRVLSDVGLIESSYVEQSGRRSSGYSSACVGERNLGYLQVQW